MDEELKAFKREERFIVIKRKHLHSYTESDLRSWLRSNDIPTSECVVVESDWPEYAQVWAMIEARVNGSAQLPSQGGEAVEWVGWTTAEPDGDGGYQLDIALGPDQPDFGVHPLMTVAQHQRILAAATHPADQVAEPDAELVELLRDAVDLIKRGDFDTGYCCCGGAVDKHGMGDGHSPVDQGGYYAMQAVEIIEEKLAILK